MRRFWGIVCLSAVLSAPLCLAAELAVVQHRSFAEMLPEDIIGYLGVSNVPELLEGVRQLPMYKVVSTEAFLDKVFPPQVLDPIEGAYGTYVRPLGTIFNGRLAMVVTTIEPAEGGIPVGYLADVAGNEAELKRYIDKTVLPAIEKAGGYQVESVTVAGLEAMRLSREDAQGSGICWAVKDGVLMVALGEGAFETLVRGAGGGASLAQSEAFAAVRERVGDADVVAYANIGAILEKRRRDMAEAGWEDSFDEGMGIAQAVTGYTEFTAAGMAVSFTPDGVLTTLFLNGQGPKGGIWGALARKPPPLESLAYIPEDSGLYIALNAGSPSDLFDELLKVLRAYDEATGWDVREGFEADLGDIEDVLGMDLQEEILPAFGGEAVVASGVPATLAVPPAVGMIEVKDKAAAKKIVARMLKLLEDEAGDDVAVTEMTFEGVEITTIAASGMVTPSVAFVGDFLVVGTHPNAIKKIITTKAGGKTLAGDATFQKYVGGLPGPASLTMYLSMRRLFDAGYPILAGLVPAEPEWEIEKYLSGLVDALGMLGDSFSGFALKIRGDEHGIVVQSVGPNGGMMASTLGGGLIGPMYVIRSLTAFGEFPGGDGGGEDWDNDDLEEF